jgi:hypothetical protein
MHGKVTGCPGQAGAQRGDLAVAHGEKHDVGPFKYSLWVIARDGAKPEPGNEFRSLTSAAGGDGNELDTCFAEGQGEGASEPPKADDADRPRGDHERHSGLADFRKCRDERGTR